IGARLDIAFLFYLLVCDLYFHLYYFNFITPILCPFLFLTLDACFHVQTNTCEGSITQYSLATLSKTQITLQPLAAAFFRASAGLPEKAKGRHTVIEHSKMHHKENYDPT
ncbi:hypothetical protein ACJX0J_021254, partial [Zea mays]